MNDAENENIVWFDPSDSAMAEANQRARESFRYFWQEQSWELRRIVPALDISVVKAPFSDGPIKEGNATVEQMWVDQVIFDGELIHGILINSPNHVQSVSEGDLVQIPVNEISDWMYAISDKVYGAFTVNVLRSQMDEQERQAHDAAWGLEFGDPSVIDLVPQDDSDRLTSDHPMSINMGESLQEYVNENPTELNQLDDELGLSMLHQLALAGSQTGTAVMIKNGADINLKSKSGMTPLSMATKMGWTAVAKLLKDAGAK